MLKIGFVVKLRSGGPEMTIVEECKNGEFLICQWWQKDSGEYRKESFPKEALSCLGDTTKD